MPVSSISASDCREFAAFLPTTRPCFQPDFALNNYCSLRVVEGRFSAATNVGADEHPLISRRLAVPTNPRSRVISQPVNSRKSWLRCLRASICSFNPTCPSDGLDCCHLELMSASSRHTTAWCCYHPFELPAMVSSRCRWFEDFGH